MHTTSRWLALLVALLVTLGGAAARAAPPTSVPAAVQPVDLNTASEADLIALPGIGPAKAGSIIAWRNRNGSFRRVDDIIKVRGFGRKTLQKLRPYLMVAVRP